MMLLDRSNSTEFIPEQCCNLKNKKKIKKEVPHEWMLISASQLYKKEQIRSTFCLTMTAI